MSSNSSMCDDLKWYLSYEILYFELDNALALQNHVVWENLVLINAGNAEEAYDKAIQHGLDSEGEVKISGQNGKCKFKGLKKLIKIYEQIEDGAEIEWREYELSKEEVSALIPPKEKLHAFQPLPPAEDFE